MNLLKMKTTFKDLGLSKILKWWHNKPETFKVGVWVFVSAGVTALCAHIIDNPELNKYSYIANLILFGLKELNKKRRK